MEEKVVKQKIILYIELSYQWHETGEESLDGILGQNITELEEEILTAFGLPFMAFQYSEILQLEGFSIKHIEKRAEKLIKKLKKTAENFLLAPIEKDDKILINAKNILQDVVEVLPIIGITTTAYNCFLYYDKFFRGILNVNELLKVLKKVEELDNIVETRIPSTYESIIQKNTFQKLIDEGLPYIEDYREYLKYKETTHNYDKFSDNYDLGDYFGLPDNIRLENFIIKYIHLKNETTCLIGVIIEYDDILIELSLWCTADLMQVLMLHAKYYSIALGPLYLINNSRLVNNEIKIILKQSVQNNVEINNIHIELERLDNEDDEIQNPFDYIITSIQAKEDLPVIHFDKKSDDLPF